MNGRFLLCCGALTVQSSFPCAKGQSASTKPALTPKIQSVLSEQIVPAYRSDQLMVALATLSDLVSRLDDPRISAVDAWLEENELPPVRELLADMRLHYVRLGQGNQLPKPVGRVLLLTLEALDEKVAVTLAERDTHPAMSDPLPEPETFKEFEDLFWSMHVLTNRLMTARQIAVYADGLARGSRFPAGRRKAPLDFRQRVREIDRWGDEFGQRQMEFRLQRLEFAHRTLSESAELKQRIFAAYAVDFDGQVLTAFLQQARKGHAQGGFALSRPRLRDDRLPAKVQELAQSGRDVAGDLVETSRLFFDGLHWWMRGRYGRGTDGNGMLKSPEALKSPLAQMALFMPTEPPQPIDPFEDGDLRTPEVDRRHYYAWATGQPRFRTTVTYFH